MTKFSSQRTKEIALFVQWQNAQEEADIASMNWKINIDEILMPDRWNVWDILFVGKTHLLKVNHQDLA